MLTVVTGWSPAGWTEYAYRFVRGFVRFWPEDVRLIVYVEALQPDLPARAEQRLLSEIPGCLEFLQRHASSRAAAGREPSPKWKDSAKAAGYSFRWDALKFCKQGFIPFHAATSLEPGLMAWLDADVVTYARVPNGFIESLLPRDSDLAYLGRGAKHSEIGFQLYRIPQALPMLATFSELYASDDVFGLKEWHSAYVFDQARVISEINAHDMTPGGEGHVWFKTPLGLYLDHLKGKRKARGISGERVG